MLTEDRRVSLHKAASVILFMSILTFVLTACSQGATMKPDFDKAVQAHLDSISNRDIDAFKANLTRDDTLYTIVQNGQAFTTSGELIEIHKQWFKDPNWIWEGEVVHKVVGEDMAMALIKYQYRAKPGDEPFGTWLLCVFKLEGGSWRIVHDQNTALDFVAFARSAGIEL